VYDGLNISYVVHVEVDVAADPVNAEPGTKPNGPEASTLLLTSNLP